MILRKWSNSLSPRNVSHIAGFFVIAFLFIVFIMHSRVGPVDDMFIGAKTSPVPVLYRQLYQAAENAHRTHFEFARYTMVDPMIVDNNELAHSVMAFTHTATITEDTVVTDTAYPYRRFVLSYDVVDRVTRQVVSAEATFIAKRGGDVRDHIIGADVMVEPVTIMPMAADGRRTS